MINGTLFTEVRQVFANWLTQTIRLAAGAYGCVIGHTPCHRAATPHGSTQSTRTSKATTEADRLIRASVSPVRFKVREERCKKRCSFLFLLCLFSGERFATFEFTVGPIPLVGNPTKPQQRSA